jgi:arabinofuranosyltransferase
MALGLIVTSFCFSFSPFRDERALEKREYPVTRIIDERAWYQERLLLSLNLRPVSWREEDWYKSAKFQRDLGRKVLVSGAIGMFSWGAGPAVHVVDSLALSDPLLARIPFSYDVNWRTGHLMRPIPEGYLQSLETGQNQLTDPCLRNYYERLSSITRGPLFSRERWSAILELNRPSGLTVRPCPVVH